ncbi:MAG: hypothetical protein ABIO83_10115 [Ilumatobacteraceae bacterium]
MFRGITRLVNPFTRTAMVAFAWSHRRSVMRWGRSLYTELRRPGRIEPRRVQQIARVLWNITSDDELANARQLREVRLDGDVLVVDAASGWKRTAKLVDALSDVPGITRIVDQQGKVLAGSIDTTAV